MSLRPEGYRSDEEYSGDDDEYDFGTDSTRQGKGSAVKPDASSWPANQLSNDTKRHSLRGEKQWRGAGRVGNSRSEGGTPSNATQRPQMRWRSRRTSNSRSHEWKRKSQENFLIAIAQEEVDGEESDQDSKGLTETCVPNKDDLVFFMYSLGLQDCLPILVENNVTFTSLLGISDEDLVRMGICDKIKRKKILQGVKEIHKREWSMPQPSVPVNIPLGSGELSVVLSHLSTHTSYLNSTVTYLRNHLNSNPHLIDPKQENEETREVLKNLSKAAESLEKLKHSFSNIENNLGMVNPAVANSLTTRSSNGQQTSWKRPFLLTVGLATAALLVIVKKNEIADSAIWSKLSHFLEVF